MNYPDTFRIQVHIEERAEIPKVATAASGVWPPRAPGPHSSQLTITARSPKITRRRRHCTRADACLSVRRGGGSPSRPVPMQSGSREEDNQLPRTLDGRKQKGPRNEDVRVAAVVCGLAVFGNGQLHCIAQRRREERAE